MSVFRISPQYHYVYGARQPGCRSDPSLRARQKRSRGHGFSSTTLTSSTSSFHISSTHQKTLQTGASATDDAAGGSPQPSAATAPGRSDGLSFFSEVPEHLDDCRQHLAAVDKELEKYFSCLKEELTLAAVRAIPASARKAALARGSLTEEPQPQPLSITAAAAAAVVGELGATEDSDDEDVTVQIDAQLTDLEESARDLARRWEELQQANEAADAANTELNLRLKSYDKQDKFQRKEWTGKEQGFHHELDNERKAAIQKAERAAARLQAVQAKLGVSEEQASDLQSQLKASRMQNLLLNSQVNSLHAKLYTSEAELADVREKLEAAESTRQVDEETLFLQSQRTEEMQQTSRELRMTLRSSALVKRELTLQLEAAGQGLENLSAMETDLREQLSEALEDKADLEEQLATVERERDELSRAARESSNVAEDMRRERVHLDRFLEKLQAENDFLVSEIDRLEDELAKSVAKQAENDFLVSEIDHLEDELAKSVAKQATEEAREDEQTADELADALACELTSMVHAESAAVGEALLVAEQSSMALEDMRSHLAFRAAPLQDLPARAHEVGHSAYQEEQPRQEEHPFIIPWKDKLVDLENAAVVLGDDADPLLDDIMGSAMPPQLLHAAEVSLQPGHDDSLPPPYMLKAMRPAECHFNRAKGEFCMRPLFVRGPERVVPITAIKNLHRLPDFPSAVDIELDDLHIRVAAPDEDTCEHLEAMLLQADRLEPGSMLPSPPLPNIMSDDE